MTEDEAKTKWCPFARVSVGIECLVAPDHRAVTRDANGIATGIDQNCIGSICMAWRWGREEVGDNPRMTKRSEADGYCGLAGKP